MEPLECEAVGSSKHGPKAYVDVATLTHLETLAHGWRSALRALASKVLVPKIVFDEDYAADDKAEPAEQASSINILAPRPSDPIRHTARCLAHRLEIGMGASSERTNNIFANQCSCDAVTSYSKVFSPDFKGLLI